MLAKTQSYFLDMKAERAERPLRLAQSKSKSGSEGLGLNFLNEIESAAKWVET